MQEKNFLSHVNSTFGHSKKVNELKIFHASCKRKSSWSIETISSIWHVTDNFSRLRFSYVSYKRRSELERVELENCKL